ncbi:lipopolysaccharide assembly protein LapB [Acaryochloris sp. IP29b_bin.148]|uniref:tetratricopeptide repeat protein n=1 Tax=Acaryochloris sp. IP29b_bin.148 TaxID=2969218 RepID=UPI002611FA84|nr:tetratricopeptide repeat protein [Acaryochloris sp. IP29b_bin.148]
MLFKRFSTTAYPYRLFNARVIKKRCSANPTAGKLISVLILSTFCLGTVQCSAEARWARILSIQGNVKVRRRGWQRFQKALHGTVLAGADFIQPQRGSRVFVICPNGKTRWLVPAGTISVVNNGCPRTPSAFRPHVEVGDLAGGRDASVPYVIAPRSGSVLHSTPIIRWNPVQKAERYVVTLSSREKRLWQINTDQTEIPYPKGTATLKPGRLYTLVVQADTGSTSLDETLKPRFNVLSEQQATAAETEISAIQAMDLPQDIKTLMLVEDIYPNYRLTARSIIELEHLVNLNIESSKVYRLLGDVYLKSGLKLLAEKNFAKAIDLATTSENLEELLLAQLGLATLYDQAGESQKSLHQFRCAQISAAELGDAQILQNIQEKLSIFEKKGIL